MEQLVERLVRRVQELGQWVEAEHTEPAEVRIIREDTASARLPEYDASQAPLISPGGDWREALNQTVWLRFHMSRPASWPVEHTALVAQRFGTLPFEGGCSISTARHTTDSTSTTG